MRVTKKADERIHKVFIDPRGNHVLFTVVSASKESPQTFYLHVQSATPEPVGKMVRANVVLDAVAWDKRGSKDVAPAENTGAFLVGTRCVLRTAWCGVVWCGVAAHLTDRVAVRGCVLGCRAPAATEPFVRPCSSASAAGRCTATTSRRS